MTKSRFKTVATYKSRTSEDRYRVTEDRQTGQIACDCKGFRFNGKCWHRDKVVDRICERGYRL